MKITAAEEKRYALLQALEDSDYVKNVYDGYFNVYFGVFGASGGEKWDLFRIYEGEFPAFNELHQYDGFVVTGSPNDAYGNDNWILKLCSLLRTLDAMKKKVLGICFGHQVLCRALGGRVGKSSTGWDIGIRKVNFVEDLPPSCNYLMEGSQNLMSSSSLSIIEIHQDVVFEVPVGAQVIASSGKTKVEMFSIGYHILGIQGHPEFTKDILLNLIDYLLNMGTIEKGFAEEVKSGLQFAEADRKCWEKICRNFLMGI